MVAVQDFSTSAWEAEANQSLILGQPVYESQDSQGHKETCLRKRTKSFQTLYTVLDLWGVLIRHKWQKICQHKNNNVLCYETWDPALTSK